MPALSSHPHRSVPETATATASGHSAQSSLEERWDALVQKGEKIAALAELGEERSDDANRSFVRCLQSADKHAADAATRGLEDMELLVSVGLKALLEVQAREKDVQAPALALWRELYHAREAVLSVLKPVPA